MPNEMVPSTNASYSDHFRQTQEQLDFLYDEITKTGEAASAERVMEACQFLRDQKVKKITAVAVGKYCIHKWKGPRASSISNKPNTLAQLVKLHDILHQLSSSKVVRRSKDAQNNFRVEDPGIAAYIRVLESKVRNLEGENQRLVQGFKKLQPLQIGLPSNDSSQAQLSAPAVPLITEIERDAIISFFQQIKNAGLSIDDRRRIVDGPMIIMERPVVDLLTKLSKAY